MVLRMTSRLPASTLRRRQRSRATLIACILGALVMWPTSMAQDNAAPPSTGAASTSPLQVRQEIYVVSEVTKDDGTKEERFSEASTAFPGQVVEYRLFVTNVSDTTLPAGIVKVSSPVPSGMSYIEDSATPSSERILTEFSADGGATYSKPPVLIGSGDDRKVAAPDAYTDVRWTLLVPMEPGEVEPFFYRVTVDDTAN